MRRIRRPALRYYGGKWRIREWIISHFPAHELYVEPYGGGASVLLSKSRSRMEVFSDLDGRVTNFFRVLRDFPQDLCNALLLTPWSRYELDQSWQVVADPIEDARRFAVYCWQSIGSGSSHRGGGSFRLAFKRDIQPEREWIEFPAFLQDIADRLQGVVIECEPALQIIDRFDKENALMYVDPPYVHQTRSRGHLQAYSHEMKNEDHIELLERLNRVRGAVLLSGYENDIYDNLLIGWKKKTRNTRCQGSGERTECLWLNEKAIRGSPILKLDFTAE